MHAAPLALRHLATDERRADLAHKRSSTFRECFAVRLGLGHRGRAGIAVLSNASTVDCRVAPIKQKFAGLRMYLATTLPLDCSKSSKKLRRTLAFVLRTSPAA